MGVRFGTGVGFGLGLGLGLGVRVRVRVRVRVWLLELRDDVVVREVVPEKIEVPS